jgi:hypothetical protein
MHSRLLAGANVRLVYIDVLRFTSASSSRIHFLFVVTYECTAATVFLEVLEALTCRGKHAAHSSAPLVQLRQDPALR